MADNEFTFEVTNLGSSAIFEATRKDFSSYRLEINDDQVVTATQGLFSKCSVLAKNAKPLVEDDKPGPVLTSLKRQIEKKCLKLIFSSEPLETSFTLTLKEVEASPLELLTKRVARLEASVPGVVYEANTTERTQNGHDVKWTECAFEGERASHGEKGPTILRPGRYQIIVSLAGHHSGNGQYMSLYLGDKEVARSFSSDNSNYRKQYHLTCFVEASKGDVVSVRAHFSGQVYGDSLANHMTIISYPSHFSS